MLEIREVSKSYGDTSVLDRVSLRLEQGRSVAILGPSGSGKTTLLRLIAGLDTPDAGEILLDGVIAGRRGWALAPHRRGIGFVFQQPALWPHMTAAQNVLFGIDRLPTAERQERLHRVLAETGLERLAHRYPDQLSGGESRRVALARAIAPRPRLILMDEPLTNLDPDAKEKLLDLVNVTVKECGCSLIYVTHDILEAKAVTGSILRLESRHLIEGPSRTEPFSSRSTPDPNR